MDGCLYLNKIAEAHNCISSNRRIINGMPVIKGTRIQVSLVLACLRDEMTIKRNM
ncbi:Protein of unknown function [Seinonella peptonophila]|uniref:Uncharacterized protein n=1 Tax=Seinonella peptonophila TaxID=112248 RepID=A0A1M5AXJ9_9BACL|nr:Protein of unknown function [Seinonella peptonophila]